MTLNPVILEDQLSELFDPTSFLIPKFSALIYRLLMPVARYLLLFQNQQWLLLVSYQNLPLLITLQLYVYQM